MIITGERLESGAVMSSARRLRTFAEFQQELQGHKGVDARRGVMESLHEQLQASEPKDALAFGQELYHAMRKHDESDSLSKAHSEGRAIFRSWHKAGAVDEIDAVPGLEPAPRSSSTAPASAVGAQTSGGNGETARPRLGFDALNLLMDPAKFRANKDAYKRRGNGAYATVELPSSLLQAHDETPSVFSNLHGTVSALLPEAHYAAFFAFNEAAKNIGRKAPPGASSAPGGSEAPPGRKDVEALAAHAKMMRASVTRPVLFDFDDIGSYNHVIADSNPLMAPHVRKGHGNHDDPVLRMGFAEKLKDPRRVNAVFYQSFNEGVPAQRKQSQQVWNEMVVKFRSTGHTASLDPDVVKGVPAIKGRPTVGLTFTPTKGNPNRSYTTVIDPIVAADPPAAQARASSKTKHKK